MVFFVSGYLGRPIHLHPTKDGGGQGTGNQERVGRRQGGYLVVLSRYVVATLAPFVGSKEGKGGTYLRYGCRPNFSFVYLLHGYYYYYYYYYYYNNNNHLEMMEDTWGSLGAWMGSLGLLC